MTMAETTAIDDHTNLDSGESCESFVFYIPFPLRVAPNDNENNNFSERIIFPETIFFPVSKISIFLKTTIAFNFQSP